MIDGFEMPLSFAILVMSFKVPTAFFCLDVVPLITRAAGVSSLNPAVIRPLQILSNCSYPIIKIKVPFNLAIVSKSKFKLAALLAVNT